MIKSKTKLLAITVVFLAFFLLIASFSAVFKKINARAQNFLNGEDQKVYYVDCNNYGASGSDVAYQSKLDKTDYSLDAKGFYWGRVNVDKNWLQSSEGNSFDDCWDTKLWVNAINMPIYSFDVPSGSYKVEVGIYSKYDYTANISINNDTQSHFCKKNMPVTYSKNIMTKAESGNAKIDIGIQNINDGTIPLSFITITRVLETNVVVNYGDNFVQMPTHYNYKPVEWKQTGEASIEQIDYTKINNFSVEGSVANLYGDGKNNRIVANVIIRPKKVKYFVNCGDITKDIFSSFADASNKVENQQFVDGSTTWGCITAYTSFSSHDMLGSLIAANGDVEKINYKFTLDSGSYKIHLGMNDPWAEVYRAVQIKFDNTILCQKYLYNNINGSSNTISYTIKANGGISDLTLNQNSSGAQSAALLSYIIIEELTKEPLTVSMMQSDDTDLPTNTAVSVMGAGEYYPNQDVVLTANLKEKCGFVFDGWYKDNVLVSRQQIYAFRFEKATKLVAKFIPMISGAIQVKINKNVSDAAIAYAVEQDSASVFGYVIKFVAPQKSLSGAVFDGWYLNKKLVSKSLDYNVPIVSNLIEIDVLYKETTKKTVVYKRNSDLIVKIEYCDSFDGYVPNADAPQRYGYTFSHWQKQDIVDVDVQEYMAVYIKNDYDFFVTVDGTSYLYKQNEFATVKSVNANFVCWKENGVIVSYDKEYRFKVFRNYTLQEVVQPEEKKPNIVIDTIAKFQNTQDSQKNAVIANALTAMPQGYQVVQRGFIGLHIGDKMQAPDENLCLNAPNIKYIRLFETSSNQIIATYNLYAKNNNFAVRAYLIYKDSSGNLFTIYSNIIYYDL